MNGFVQAEKGEKMADLIDRQELISWLSNEPLIPYVLGLISAIESRPSVDAEPRWIPIEQDCPKMGKDVLISHNGVVSIDWLTQSEGVRYFFVSGVAVQDIDAWMPLPEPYKEKNDEQTD